MVTGCWGGGHWAENLVCLGCLCNVGFGGVGFVVVVRVLVGGVSDGIGEDLVGRIVGILGRAR